jgi:phosphatidylinositol alpha-mannosyltransferase
MLFDGYMRPSEGVPSYIMDVGDYLDNRGHQTFYMVGGYEGDRERVVPLGRTACFGVNGNQVELALPITARRADEVLAQVSPDILHLQMPNNPFVSGRIIKRAEVPVVATFHVLPDSRMISLSMQVLLGLSRNRPSEIISNSKATQDFLKQRCRIESTLIPNPVDVQRFQAGKRLQKYDDGKTNILFFGRLVERKGAQHLITAVAGLGEKARKDLRVIIAGKGEQEGRLRQQVERLGLGSFVEFAGYIDERDKPNLLASADIAAFPATGGESFGIVLAEAMAARAGVVIGGNNPGYSSVLEPTKEALFDPKNQSEFTALLSRLISEKDERERIHSVQQALVQKFDIAVVGQAIERVYQRALEK